MEARKKNQMAGRKAKLTKKTMDALKPEAARYVVHDTEIPGFIVKVQPLSLSPYFPFGRIPFFSSSSSLA